MSSAQSIIGQLKTQAGDIPVLGSVVFWNVRDVEVTRDWFKNHLNQVGLDGEKYAKEHNYRSTFIRCLRALEERRIIRKVEEDADRLIYQFTSEVRAGDDANPHLEYTPETIVEIDKDTYWTLGDFNEALVKCDDRFRPTLVEMFNKEKSIYRSSDITRYVQSIFNDQADIVSLRPQGSVYFVPAPFQNVVTQVAQVLAAVPVGTATLEHIPVPDVETSRHMVKTGVEAEIAEVFAGMEDDIKKMQAKNGEITEKWVEFRRDRINQIKKRLELYQEVLGATGDQLRGKFDALAATLAPRTLEL